MPTPWASWVPYRAPGFPHLVVDRVAQVVVGEDEDGDQESNREGVLHGFGPGAFMKE